jgi:hypothetical protein
MEGGHHGVEQLTFEGPRSDRDDQAGSLDAGRGEGVDHAGRVATATAAGSDRAAVRTAGGSATGTGARATLPLGWELMDDASEDFPRPPLRPRQVFRLVLPVFAASILVMVIGVILVVTHHRTPGIIVFVIGVIGGFAVRARLLFRAQQGRRPPN